MKKTKAILGYYDLGKKYPKQLPDNLLEDFCIGLYYKGEGGCDCEFTLKLEKFENHGNSWKLGLYQDCWSWLERFQPLLEALSKAQEAVDKQHEHRSFPLTKDAVVGILHSSGFKDMYSLKKKEA